MQKTTNHRSGFLAWWQLLRAGNMPTAASNVVAGFLLVQGEWQPVGLLLMLIASSLLLYEAGMVLNDAFDTEQDTAERPERPIPSGRISRGNAFFVGWTLLAGGLCCAWLASWLSGQWASASVGTLLAGAVVGYDAGLKKLWCGPLAMGLCRLLNLLLGASAGLQPNITPRQDAALLVAMGIGLYTVGLTRFARAEAQTSCRRDLALGGATSLLGMLLLAMLPTVLDCRIPVAAWATIWAGLGILAGGVMRRAVLFPTQNAVQSAAKVLILLFIVFDAAVCLGVVGGGAALAVLSLLVPALLASRWAPVT